VTKVVHVVVGVCALALATACTRVVEDAQVVAGPDRGTVAASASSCTPVDAPLTTIPDHDADEPVMKIPQPAGWERMTQMDSELIRFTMRNESLAKDGFAPTAVVTLESNRGNTLPRKVFDAQQRALKVQVGATDLRSDETTLCGLPAETVDYTMPRLGSLAPHPAKVVTAVLHTDDTTYAMTMTLQSVDPDNPAYQSDSDKILTGFQMLPPSGG